MSILFYVFRPINLKLRKNEHLTAPNFKTYLTEDEFQDILPEPPRNCHFIHRDDSAIAAISFCEPRAMVPDNNNS